MVNIVQTLTMRCETLAVTAAEQNELIVTLGGKITELELQISALRSPDSRPAKRQKLSNKNASQPAEKRTPLVVNNSGDETPQGTKNYAQVARTPLLAEQQYLTPSASATYGVADKKSRVSLAPPFQQDRKKAPTQKELQNQHVLRKHETMTVICSNVPEPTSESLKGRQLEEQTRWTEICHALGLNIVPTGLTRLSRNRSSPHVDKPRLLRVTFGNTRDLEDVLLASHVLVKSSLNTRIFPDRPWEERQQRKSDPSASRNNEAGKVVLIYGVPELRHDDKCERHKHDVEEWKYITEIYNMQSVVAFDITRLAASPNYQGRGPKIVKVTLARPEMVTAAIRAWHDNKKRGPPEVRLRPFLPTVKTLGTDVPDPTVSTSDQPSALTPVPKNFGRPAQTVPVQHSDSNS